MKRSVRMISILGILTVAAVLAVPAVPAQQPATPAPQSTTPAPQSTTPAPQSTTPAPQSTTPAPQSTTPAPQSTTPGRALAQPPQSTPQDIGAPSPTETRVGRIERFTHAPTGEIDGFVFEDGLIIHYPVYLSRQVTQMLGEQRQVRVSGLLVHGTQPRAATILEAQTIDNLGTKQRLTVTGTEAEEPGTVTSVGGTAVDDGAASAPPPAR